MPKFSTYEAMIEAAREEIMNSSETSSVLIGCDSLRFKKNKIFHANYSIVVILHKDSKHGAQLFHFTESFPDYGSMKQRLMTEVGYAVRAGTDLLDVIGKRPFEIHIDINTNPKHKSNIAMKEAVGYVQGTFGFMPILKPASLAATHGADHIVRH